KIQLGSSVHRGRTVGASLMERGTCKPGLTTEDCNVNCFRLFAPRPAAEQTFPWLFRPSLRHSLSLVDVALRRIETAGFLVGASPYGCPGWPIATLRGDSGRGVYLRRSGCGRRYLLNIRCCGVAAEPAQRTGQPDRG